MVKIIQGEDKTLQVTLTTLDLTSVTEITANFLVSPSISKTMTGGAITVTTAAAGKFNIVLPRADTVNIPPGNHQLEIVVDFGASSRKIFEKIAFTVLPRLS